MSPNFSLNDRKEQFSKVYVRAVAAVTGYDVTEPPVDRDSVDLNLHGIGGDGTVTSPRLDVQTKCTALEAVPQDAIPYALPVKNYNDLRPTTVAVPRILVIVIVPPDLTSWLTASEEELVLRRCGYWCSLRGEPATQNVETLTVHVPRANVFDDAGLEGIMDTIRNGAFP